MDTHTTTTPPLHGAARTSGEFSPLFARAYPPLPVNREHLAAASRLKGLVDAMAPEQRWNLANRVKRLKRFCSGMAIPDRVELATMEEVTGWDLSDFALLLPAIDWESATDSRSAVKVLREALGWTRARLAQECGIDVSALSRIERGSTQPSETTATRLAHIARSAGAPEQTLKRLGTRTPSFEEAIALLARLGVAAVKADTVEDGVAIGKWLADAKRALEQEEHSGELRDRMAELGYVSRREVWQSRYEELRARAHRDGQALVFSRSDEIESWVSDQRRLHAAGSLSAWKVRLLEEVPGWRWGVGKQEQWMATYERVATAVQEAGLTSVRRSWIAPDGLRAGDWLARARKRAAHGHRHVDAQRRALLQQLPPAS